MLYQIQSYWKLGTLMLGSILLTYACGAGDKKPQQPKIDRELRISLAELLIKSKAYDEAIPIVKKAMELGKTNSWSNHAQDHRHAIGSHCV